MEMKLPKHYMAAISAFIIWGFFSIVLKPLYLYPSLDILFYRVFACIIIMLLINIAFRRDKIKETKNYFSTLTKKEKRNQWLLIFGSSLLLTANWFFFIYVMNHISVKAASFAYMVCPILTTVFAWFILKEKLTRLQWMSVFLSMLSCVILSYNSFTSALYSVVIASSYAVYLVLQKKITMPDRFILLTLQIGFTALILLPFYKPYSGPVPTEPLFYCFILMIAVGFTIVPMFLNLFALKGINSSTVGILIYLNPIIAFTLAIVYYDESVTLIQAAAYFVIVISVILFNVGSYLKLKEQDMPINRPSVN